jgi:hypothetical protein
MAPEPERVGTVEEALTVDEAVNGGCSTKIVEGLSKQIIAQAECIAMGAFSPVPKRPNVTFGSAVLPSMQEPGRDALLAALDANPGTKMTINSMLRTVAQQYLLYRWYLGAKCGIALAAKPGTSNHETGLAIDVQEYSTWRPKLEAKGFSWLGSNDPVHFDYEGPGSANQSGVGVKAFQQLWNLNHPEDPIAEDGDYGPQTEARLKKSPAEGFATAPTDCGGGGGGGGGEGGGGPTPAGDLELAVALPDAPDAFSDGPSKGVPDLVLGRRYTLEVTVTNGTDAELDASSVTVALPGALASDGAATVTLPVEALMPGEKATLTTKVDALAYSVLEVAPASIEATLGDVSTTRTLDVYSDRRWDFDGERLEGWTSAQMIAVTSTAEMGDAAVDGELVLSGAAADLAAESPAIEVSTAGLGDLVLRARRSGDSDGAARLVLGDLELALELPADGELHELVIPESSLPATITRVRFVPFQGGTAKSATAAIASLVLGERRGVRPGDDGCGCGLAPGERVGDTTALAWSAVLVGFTVAVRRRRRR